MMPVGRRVGGSILNSKSCWCRHQQWRYPAAAAAAAAPGGRASSTSAGGDTALVRTIVGEMDAAPFPPWLVKELRTNHAGEYGAVRIYEGAMAGIRLSAPTDAVALDFLAEHRENEAAHLSIMTALTARTGSATRLIPVWHLAGLLTGFLPAMLGGPRAVYFTVAAVETFVEEHYTAQITRLEAEAAAGQGSAHAALCSCLKACCEEEVEHRHEAEAALLQRYSSAEREPGTLIRAWVKVVDAGSRAAVLASRVF